MSFFGKKDSVPESDFTRVLDSYQKALRDIDGERAKAEQAWKEVTKLLERLSTLEKAVEELRKEISPLVLLAKGK